jgi:hypothetical protein
MEHKHKDLPIKQLPFGANERGVYRGQRVFSVPAIEDQPEIYQARVFLDAEGGPVAIEVNEDAIRQVKVLATDGDSIIVQRPAADRFIISREDADE